MFYVCLILIYYLSDRMIGFSTLNFYCENEVLKKCCSRFRSHYGSSSRFHPLTRVIDRRLNMRDAEFSFLPSIPYEIDFGALNSYSWRIYEILLIPIPVSNLFPEIYSLFTITKCFVYWLSYLKPSCLNKIPLSPFIGIL